MEGEPSLTATPQQLTLAYVGLVLIWSTTPLAVVVSLRDLHPIWAMGLRFLLAAVIAGVCLRVAGLRLSWDKAAWRVYGAAFLSMFGTMLFTYLGASTVPSGMISVLFGLSPLLVGLFGQLLPGGQRLALGQWGGLALGLVGLAVVMGVDQLHLSELRGLLYVLTGVSCYVGSVLWLKRLRSDVHPLAQTTVAIWLSAVASLLVLPFYVVEAPTHQPHLISLIGLLYSASIASIVAMLCYFFLIRHLSANSVALTSLLTPVLAVLLGMLVNGERFRPTTALGMATIVAGLLLYYLHDLRAALAASSRLRQSRAHYGEARDAVVPE